jgi:hypothetical protein
LTARERAALLNFAAGRGVQTRATSAHRNRFKERGMRHQHLGSTLIAATLTLLSACASGIPLRESDAQVRDRYNAYAGDPIEHFSWLGGLDGWEPIGRYQMVLFTGPSDAYLITVGPPCENLQFAQRVGVSSTSSEVYARFDSIITGRDRCPIQEIRKIDYRRMRADMRLDAQKARAAAAPQR